MREAPPRYLTPPQAGKLLGMKPDSIVRLIRSGRLRALNVSPPGSKRPRFRIDPDDIRRCLQYHPDPPKAKRYSRNGVCKKYF